MANPQFSIRLSEYTLRCIDYIAEDYTVSRSQVVTWACEAYVELVKANDAKIPSKTEMATVLDYIRAKALGAQPSVVQFPMAAETPHEPGKVINPAAAGGAGQAKGQKYPTAKLRKSSR